MCRFISIVLTASLAVFAATAYADPPGRVARLAYTSGAVSFAPGEDPERWSPGIVNRPLTSGDRLWTERDGYAEAQVGSTALRLAPLTNVDVLHLDDDRMLLRLPQGSMNLRVGVLDPDDVIEIATPDGTVVVREPGSYRINVDPNGQVTRVAVHSGHVDALVADRRLPVPSGRALALTGGSPGAFETASFDDFDRWSAELDRRAERSVSTRYVSPHMTGHEELDRYGTWSTVPEYGPVWRPTRVAADWAPYRHGHWEWVSPWGWTWIDDAPWGFAPSHYGRWVYVHDHWAWAPGHIVRRPVYAPALVAFVGGSNWSVSVSSGGPAVGWFPLGWREPYRPWYRTSPRYVENVNITHVRNVTNITNITHVHRNRPDAVTVVSRDNFVSARPAGRDRIRVAQGDLARAEVIRDRQPAERLARRESQRAERETGATSPAERAAIRAQTEQRVQAEQREQSAVRARGPREPVERSDGTTVQPGQARNAQSAQAERQRAEQRQQAAQAEQRWTQQRQQATQAEQQRAQQRQQAAQAERQRAGQRQQAAQAEQQRTQQRQQAAQAEQQRAQQRQQAAQREQAEQQRAAQAERQRAAQREQNQRQRAEVQRQSAPRAEPPRERAQRRVEASAQPAAAPAGVEVRRKQRAQRDG